MSSPRTIPQEARSKQERASDPAISAFVSANAGSGKTHVLVQRVIRLMLGGVSPEKILCITFTKAAAANMAERVFSTLGRWVTFDDADLDAAIRSSGIATVDARMRARARELFACALETPGGLKVQTIHALCTRLLQQFPFESQVPARFSVMDDRDRAEMLERANFRVLLEAADRPGSAAGRALAVAMTHAADMTFSEVIGKASLDEKFLAWADSTKDVPTALAQLSAALGVSPQTTMQDVEREIVDGPILPSDEWTTIADVLSGGTSRDQDQAKRLQNGVSAINTTDRVECYRTVFFDSKGLPRSKILTDKFARQVSALADRLKSEQERVVRLFEQLKAIALRDRTHALLVIAADVAKHYRDEKAARGLLDYDDLIVKTREMLDRIASGWVHFKLDRGIDHVLIDEAQDTSPKQWDIVAKLIEEFTSGKGARDGVKRTIFAVGDEKQSIFSFQGAAPREFDTRRRELKAKFTGAGLAFDPVSFNYSFRSGEAILASVDSVFRDEAIYRSIHADKAYPVHQSLDDAGPSLIDLWELQEADPREAMEGWRAAFDAKSSTSPEVKIAERVRAEIATLIAAGTQTGPQGKRRALSYGDVLILVKRRNSLFDTVIQALKHANIPVAGADRLKLTTHIAIVDLMHLADALLFAQDDFALAVALKSPLFNLSEDDLFKLAYAREGTLRASLQQHAPNDAKLNAAWQRLQECAQRAAHDTPFAFFAWLLGGDGGRARILKRLGPEANDALDEFLELALGFERRAPASLQGFVAWLRAADTDIKRDMEARRDEVRVMTVHGAKGLEAPVVFLIDTTAAPSDSTRLSLISIPQTNAPDVVVWAGAKGEDCTNVAAARALKLQEEEDEYRRLLYVAMTRAADRLIVGGKKAGNRSVDHTWYDLIAKGLAASGLDMTEIETANGVVRRYTRGALADMEGAAKAAAGISPLALPDWLRQPARPAVPPRPAIRPSDADAVWRRTSTQEDVAARNIARLRGTLTHRLLQSLPDIPPERRDAAATAFLERNAAEWNDDIRATLAANIAALIADPRFAAIFAPGSRAEVPIVGRLSGQSGPILVSGQIDRLVATETDFLIVDFKTGSALIPPPISYVRQLALYRAVLAKLYSGRAIRAALLWTETLDWAEIPADDLDTALESVISGS